MKKLTISLALATVATFALATSAIADGVTNCQPIYGGGQTCATSANIQINKKVSNPQSGSYVDNLGVNDAHYAPEQSVNFQITVTNTGGSDLAKVTVKDIFPQYVTFVSGVGNFDSNIKTLSFDVANLKAGEARTFTLSGKIVAGSNLPEQSVTCVVNQAQVTADNGQTASDNAQFCIEKALVAQAPATSKGGLKVFPPAQAKTTPSTGPESLVLFALAPTGLLGQFLRKKSGK